MLLKMNSSLVFHKCTSIKFAWSWGCKSFGAPVILSELLYWGLTVKPVCLCRPLAAACSSAFNPSSAPFCLQIIIYLLIINQTSRWWVTHPLIQYCTDKDHPVTFDLPALFGCLGSRWSESDSFIHQAEGKRYRAQAVDRAAGEHGHLPRPQTLPQGHCAAPSEEVQAF